MAKRLKKDEKYRANICFECGCIPSRQAWKKITEDKGDDYKSVMYIANQFPISEDEVVTIEDLQTKEEIHAVADNYNWDNDRLDSLYAFINHPLCDAGTALLLFWKGGGYNQLGREPLFPNEEEKSFYREIVLRFKSKKFNTYKIAFNPKEEGYIPPLDECLERGYFIPGEFFCDYSTMFLDTELP